MNRKSIANFIFIDGIIILVGAIAWWAWFYSSLLRDVKNVPGGKLINAGLSDVTSCLYSSAGNCDLIAGAARIAGRTVYQPAVFWLGVAVLVIGFLAKLMTRGPEAGR
jgi:hypothetical protein